MDSSFDQAIKFVLRWEGGYSNDPRDPGGETKFGISKRAHPSLNIANLTEDEAKVIYKVDYWNKAGCSQIAYPLDIVVFDTAVNQGVGRALEFLRLTHDVETYLLFRLSHYVALSTAKTYLLGWSRRVISLWKEVRGV